MCVKALAGLFGGGKSAPTATVKPGATITNTGAGSSGGSDPTVTTGGSSGTDRVGIGIGTKKAADDSRTRVPGLGL